MWFFLQWLSYFFPLWMDLTSSLVACWDYGWSLNVNTFRIVWDHYLVMSMNNWSFVMNKSDTWMWCGCSDPGCGHGWWHHVTEWWGVCPAFPLITLWTREPSHEKEDGSFSVYWSLCISIKERFPCHACLCECVNGCICPSSSSSPPTSQFVHESSRCWGEEEVGRCHSNRVTAYGYSSGGEWPSGETWRLCGVNEPDVKMFDDALKGVWDSLTIRTSAVPFRDTLGISLDWVQFSVILVQEASQTDVYSLCCCAFSAESVLSGLAALMFHMPQYGRAKH